MPGSRRSGAFCALAGGSSQTTLPPRRRLQRSAEKYAGRAARRACGEKEQGPRKSQGSRRCVAVPSAPSQEISLEMIFLKEQKDRRKKVLYHTDLLLLKKKKSNLNFGFCSFRFGPRFFFFFFSFLRLSFTPKGGELGFSRELGCQAAEK